MLRAALAQETEWRRWELGHKVRSRRRRGPRSYHRGRRRCRRRLRRDAADGNGASEGGGTECTAAANSRSSAPSSVSSIQPRLGGGMDARRGTSRLSTCASSSVTVGISVGIPGIPGLGIGLTAAISSWTPGSLFSSSDDAAEGEVSEVIAGGGVARLSGDAGDVGFDSCTAVSAPSAPFSAPPAGSSISAAPRLSSASVSLSNSSLESTAGS